MTGPVNVGGRLTRPLDEIMTVNGATGWDALEKAFAPAQTSDRFRPQDGVLRVLASMYAHHETRAVLEWLFDLTCRAPYPRTPGSTEELAYAAAKHQARAAVGDVIATAIAEGQRLIEQDGARR